MRIHATDCASCALLTAKHLEPFLPPTEALAVALLSQRDTAAERLLAECGLAAQDVHSRFQRLCAPHFVSSNEEEASWRTAIAAALDEANQYGPEKAWMDTAHLLVGLVIQRGSLAAKMLQAAGVDVAAVRDASRKIPTIHAVTVPASPSKWESLAASFGLRPFRRATELLSAVGVARQ